MTSYDCPVFRNLSLAQDLFKILQCPWSNFGGIGYTFDQFLQFPSNSEVKMVTPATFSAVTCSVQAISADTVFEAIG